MPFNFSSPEYLSHHKRRKNRVSPVSRASPAHMNSPLGAYYMEASYPAKRVEKRIRSKACAH